MNYYALLKGRARALLMDFSSLAVIIIAVAVSIYISKYSGNENARGIIIEIVNEDKGMLGSRLIEILSLEETFKYNVTTYDEAIKEVAGNKAQGIIEIVPDFSEKIGRGEYESLVHITVMADSYDMTTFTEMVINDVIKVWSEKLVEKRIGEIDGVGQDDLTEFREQIKDVWNRESLLDVESVMGKEEKTEEEENYFGIRWYAVLSMFYLCISGTWMCNYSSTGLLRRVSGQGGNIASLFIFQSLPGIVISFLGFIPVIITSGHPDPVNVFISFGIYICSSAAIALIICCISGKFSNLVLISPVSTMVVSLFSGLLCELPDWARLWDITSVIIPGHWLYNAIFEKRFFLGSILVLAGWFMIGICISWIFSKKKNH
ncbi:ABC transporter permease [Oribacterium sp. WCC10]|uniref:ABC transporter permease n=1 Tax=Oribacterium sp. WCC10 TaxID=1855343 RepID=UPI0008F35BD9|nr:ABC transporter permease [Oribacterium sp. WCC10]SFG73247.1 ABC-2 family transporter protein [Oribacterium sp. WCC10]